jgi:hypothetical protein
VTAVVVPVVVAVIVAMMTRLVPMPEFAMPRGMMKAAIAMFEALRLGGGHGQAECGKKCKCEQFFG